MDPVNSSGPALPVLVNVVPPEFIALIVLPAETNVLCPHVFDLVQPKIKLARFWSAEKKLTDPILCPSIPLAAAAVLLMNGRLFCCTAAASDAASCMKFCGSESPEHCCGTPLTMSASGEDGTTT